MFALTQSLTEEEEEEEEEPLQLGSRSVSEDGRAGGGGRGASQRESLVQEVRSFVRRTSCLAVTRCPRVVGG